MTFNEYEKTLSKFDVSNGELWYYGLGLAGEAGEATDKIKKWYRDNNRDTQGLVAELGDTLWYLTRLASKLGVSLESVAQGNVDKLTARHNTGTLHGTGDYREQRGA